MGNTHKPAIPPWRRYLVRIATVDAIVFIAVFVICLLTDALTWLEYGNGLVLAGAAIIGVGVFSLVGGWSQTRRYSYVQAESVGDNTMLDRANREVSKTNESLRFMLESIALSLLPLAAGALLQIAFATPPV